MRRGEIDWGRVLRQGAACFMATAAVCVLALGAGAGAAAGTLDGISDEATAAALLRAELGSRGAGEGLLDRLSPLERLAVGESALLHQMGTGREPDFSSNIQSESLPSPGCRKRTFNRFAFSTDCFHLLALGTGRY